MNPRPTLLPLVATVAILSISTAAVLIKLCDDAPPAVIAAARLGLATLILLPGAIITRGRRPIRVPPRLRGHLILAGAFLGTHFFFWVSSLKHTSVASSVAIATTNPIFLGVASMFLFKEPMRRALLIGIALAAAGGITIAATDRGPANHGHLYGDLLAMLGALNASCYYLVGRRVRGEVDLISYILPVYAVAALIPTAIALAGRPHLLSYRPSTYIYFVLLAIIPQLIGHGALNWCLRHVTATTVGVFILGEPIGATVLAYFVQGEKIGAAQTVGGGLILAGVLIATRRSIAPSTPSGPPPA